jgi:hypothetical protein
MDLRAYYQKIRTLEASLAEGSVVVVSRETPDGGKPGVKTAVSRSLAAKLIVEDQAALASPEEAAEFRAALEQGRLEAESEEPPIAKTRGKRQ